MNPVEVRRGTSPVILGLPHTGTHVPAEIWDRLNANGRLLRDTDWHIHTLYDGLLSAPRRCAPPSTAMSSTPTATRQGRASTPARTPPGWCRRPISTSSRSGRRNRTSAISSSGWLPSTNPITQALAAEIARVKAEHGVAILYDCHSIRSVVPFLFEGRLPDFNIGTNDGKSCAREIEEATRAVCAGATGYSHVVNGRFKGGWTTRHYGRPGDGVHAIQMELTQATHLESEALPFAYSLDEGREAAGLSARHPWRAGTDAGDLAAPTT